MTDPAECRRESLENAMAQLARVRMILELTSLRTGQVRDKAPALLGPAIDELDQAQDRIIKAQSELAELWNRKVWL